MEINLSCEDLEKLKSLINIKNSNIELSSFFNDYIYEYGKPLNNYEVKGYFKINNNLNLSFVRALKNDIEFEQYDQETKKIIEEQALNNIKHMNYDFYVNNPYYQNIKIPKVKEQNWKLTLKSFKPFQLIIADDLHYLDNYKEQLSLGFFDKEFFYPTVIENNTLWMSITPSEIDTMIDDIENASGKVITFGLGLGYYPYMLSLKSNVESITIVEKDQRVINLFTKHILPQFKYKEKINILNSDAYELLNNKNFMDSFDYIYIDIWHGGEDGVYHYVKMKKIEKTNNQVFHYWLEPSIIGFLRRCLISLFEEKLNNFKESDYTKSQNEFDDLINSLYFKTKNIVFSSYTQILKFLDDNSIKELIKEL